MISVTSGRIPATSTQMTGTRLLVSSASTSGEVIQPISVQPQHTTSSIRSPCPFGSVPPTTPSMSTSINIQLTAAQPQQQEQQQQQQRFSLIILYSDESLSDLLRIRLTLSLKAVECRLCRIDLNSNEHRSDDYRRLNPADTLPLLLGTCSQTDTRFVMSDMQAILEFIEEAFPSPPTLMPVNSLDRARARILMSRMLEHDRIERSHSPTITEEDTSTFPTYWPPPTSSNISNGFDETMLDLEHYLLTFGICGFDGQLEGKYCMGDEVSLTDCCLLPILMPPPLQQHSVLQSGLPENLSKVARNLLELEAVKVAITAELLPNMHFASLREQGFTSF